MAVYVLVHGGWHGGWCWRAVAARLRAAGHEVFCPTMTGLGERSHLLSADITPETHVRDIANVLTWNDLRDVVLVGHSYAGLIVTGVAARLAERIGHLAYLDAFVPLEADLAPMDMARNPRRPEIEALAKTNTPVEPYGFENWSADPDRQAWLRQFATPHPSRCFTMGVSPVVDVSGLDLGRTYILCGDYTPSPFWQYHNLYKDDPRWRCYVMDCFHDAMVDQPDALAALLLEAGAT